jgi:hypothetical protein
VILEQPPPEGRKYKPPDEARWKRKDIRNTLSEGATRIAEDASIRRYLRMPRGSN